MKKSLFSVSILLSSYIFAQSDLEFLRPLPQNIEVKTQSFNTPKTFSIKYKDISKELNNFISSNFETKKKAFPVELKTNSTLEKEAYILDIQSKKITISAGDERGLYYGLLSLKEILSNEEYSNQLKNIKISDAPDVPYRGVVEGFYGTPWSHNARLRQIQFYGENKLNTYIYGPKDDPYHSSPNWRKPYPKEEAENIKQLIQQSQKYFVDFVWAIHPGKDIQWNDEDRQNILQKFSAMYDLGVRSFAVFFDDIFGDGTDPKKQAELLNFIDEEFVKKKPGVQPLIMCPTEYNKAWSNTEKGYLKTLGTLLNKDIQIMWTGDTVIGDVTQTSVDWINNQIQRKAYFWWNFPVSDYVRDHILMGRAYGLDPKTKGMLSGLVSNPMEHAEASKTAIYSMSQFAWNMRNYHSEKAWKEGIKKQMPSHFEALYFFSKHNSDLGPNGHQYRREESIDFQPIANSFLKDIRSKNQSENIELVKKEYEKMIASAEELLSSKENPYLIQEIRPWLIQFKNLGELGLANIQLYYDFQNNDLERFTKSHQLVKEKEKKFYEHSESTNKNGIVVGTLVMKPLTEEIFRTFTEKFNEKYGKNLEVSSQYIPHLLFTNISNLKNQPLLLKKQVVEIAPKLEPITLKSNEYFGIELEQNKKVSRIIIDLNDKNWQNLVVKISNDGKNWSKIDGNFNDKNTEWSCSNVTSKFIIIENTSKSDKTVYLKRFSVNME